MVVRIDRIVVLVLSVGLLAGIGVGALPMVEPQSQPVSDTQNFASSGTQSQPPTDAQGLYTPKHEIIAEDHIDVPEQTVTLRGETYEIKLIGRGEVGEQLNVRVEGPENETYSPVLVNPRGPPSDVSPPMPARGNSRPSFDTTGIPPGMYFVAVRNQNQTQTVQPVVVSATETSLSGPDCLGTGSTAVFEVYVNEGQAGDISHVELVAFNQNRTIRTAADRERANLYRAELPLENVSQTDTKLLVHAKIYTGDGQDNSRSLQDVVGISKQHTLFVVEDEAHCG